MEVKKNPQKDVYRLERLWFNAGLFLALCIIIMAFEWKSYERSFVNLPKQAGEVDDWAPPVTIPDIPKPPKPVLAKPVEVEDDEPVEVEPPEDIFDIERLEDFKPIVEDEPEIEKAEEPPFNTANVEVQPQPDGGYQAFYKFISKNIRYPKKAINLGIEGRVYAQFIIDKDGQITDLQVIRGIGAGCDEEVLRLMNKAPKWIPGKQRGKPVRVRMILPINFELNN